MRDGPLLLKDLSVLASLHNFLLVNLILTSPVHLFYLLQAFLDVIDPKLRLKHSIGILITYSCCADHLKSQNNGFASLVSSRYFF